MKNASPAPWGRSLETFAQTGTRKSRGIKTLPGIVRGQGVHLARNKQLQRWAEEKFINDHIILALVDVARRKGDSGRKQTYWNCYHCCRHVTTSPEGTMYVDGYCKTRICSICNGIRKAEKINSYLPVIKHWPDPFYMTLSVTSPKAENLNTVIDQMYSLFNRIVGRYKKKKQRGGAFQLIGIKTFECTYNPTADTYHPHFHVVVASKEMSFALYDSWLHDGRKLWGEKAVSQAGQSNQRIKKDDLVNKLIDCIKYGTKIVTETDPRQKKKSKKGIYIEALDTIIAVTARRRLFDRFGFNLPKRPAKKTQIKKLDIFKEWQYNTKNSDWLELEGSLSLTNYTAPDKLKVLLEESIFERKHLFAKISLKQGINRK